MSSANNWNYVKAIPAFKKIATDPISEAYTPYGLPYYVIIAGMISKGKMNLVTDEYDFKIENGKLVRILGPSVYAGSKMNMGAQPKPVFRSWPEYLKAATPVVEKDLKSAASDYKALVQRVETLYSTHLGSHGALSEDAIAKTTTVPFATNPGESFYYTESQGFKLELRQSGGGTEIYVGMNLDTGKLDTTLASRALIQNDKEYKTFIDFVTHRKPALEAHALKMIPKLKASPYAQSEAKFAADIKTLEKDIDNFYVKHCKSAIEMLKGANQLQTVI